VREQSFKYNPDVELLEEKSKEVRLIVTRIMGVEHKWQMAAIIFRFN
jgi:hypothetical protein